MLIGVMKDEFVDMVFCGRSKQIGIQGGICGLMPWIALDRCEGTAFRMKMIGIPDLTGETGTGRALENPFISRMHSGDCETL
jgi:hypothetical protein